MANPKEVAYLELRDAGPDAEPSQRYRTVLIHENGLVLFASSEGYTDADEALRQARKTFIEGAYDVQERLQSDDAEPR